MLTCNESKMTVNDYLEKKFRLCYQWILNNDISKMPVGVYPLTKDPREVYAQVQEYTTAPWEEVKYEAHDKYFDVHYIVEGEEIIGVCRRELLKENEFIESNDMHYFDEPERSSSIYLKKGDLLVVAPEDAHKPRVCTDAPAVVKKVCFKVKA